MELEDLIESIDIVDYISQFVDLEEKNGEYWGLSPFKDEKTPSFSVRRETNSFYDFSSGIEQHCANHCGTVFVVVNHTPNIHNEDRTEVKRNIEERLYSVFSKYTTAKH